MSAHLILRRHADAVADALTDAFLDDPVMVWLAGHDDPVERAATLRAAVFAPAAAAVLRTGWGLAVPGPDATVAGAALWNPPGTSFFADEDRGAIAEGLAEAAEGAGGRLRALVVAMHERHLPTDECFHLQFIGVTAAARSRGLGVQLVAPVLERCDAERLPAALDSSNPRNISFYRRLGFEVLWEIRPEGGPPLQAMWRAPRRSG